MNDTQLRIIEEFKDELECNEYSCTTYSISEIQKWIEFLELAEKPFEYFKKIILDDIKTLAMENDINVSMTRKNDEKSLITLEFNLCYDFENGESVEAFEYVDFKMSTVYEAWESYNLRHFLAAEYNKAHKKFVTKLRDDLNLYLES